MALTPEQRRQRARRTNLMMAYAYAAASTKGWTPAQLATGASTWAWYDPSDRSTLFQDAAGTTPVAAAGDPVGLMLDKSQELALGPELTSNSSFDSDTAWSKGAGWTIGGGVATRPADAGGSSVSQAISLTAGVLYRVEFTITAYTAGSFRARFTGGTAVDGIARTAVGTYVEYFVALTGNTTFAISANTAATAGSVDNVSVRALLGNHALQSTAAARPIYRIDANGRPYLEFDGTDDSLATGNIDPGSVDKAQVFAGLRKLTAVGTSTMLMETSVSSGANNGTIAVQAPETAQQYRYRSRGTAFSDAQTTSAGFAAPITNVLCGLGDISGDTATLRINGADIQTSLTDQGTGNFTSQPLYIGARAGTSLFFNGWLYGLIVRFSAANLDSANVAAAETWMNGKTGAF